MAVAAAWEETCAKAQFLGLAPFLRKSIAGEDLRPLAEQLFLQAGEHPEDAALFMNLSIALQCLGQHEIGLEIQNQALLMQRVYRLPATESPPVLRVLMLMIPGDLSANTPLECLFETGDIELIHYYLTPGDPFAAEIPAHDMVLVALGESPENLPILEQLVPQLANWPCPVINSPLHIPFTNRQKLSQLLQHAPGVLMPKVYPASRGTLQNLAQQPTSLADVFPGCNYPIIIRPIDSQAGRDLEKIESIAELGDYLSRIARPDFFISRFIDYRSTDGFYRKMRIVLIDGVPLASHFAISANWMIHYVNAGMYEDAWKREQEAAFLENFEQLTARHRDAITAIHERLKLDYICIDCAELPHGELLVFEIDHCMVVHAMDSLGVFPYKQEPLQKLKQAFRAFLLRKRDAAI